MAKKISEYFNYSQRNRERLSFHNITYNRAKNSLKNKTKI